jgi:hypothetical protein
VQNGVALIVALAGFQLQWAQPDEPLPDHGIEHLLMCPREALTGGVLVSRRALTQFIFAEQA